ncbi:MAG: XRE family transcriptional regulator [Anaerolineae bacterium]|nr:XRE family transcriptional regulator [Anaerolineae bacterium]
MTNKIGSYLTDELEQRGWSHSELARRAGVAQVTVSLVIAGKRNPGCDFCIKIAQALGESPEKLLRLADILPPALGDNATVQEIMDTLKQLPEQEQEEVLKYAKFRLQQQK